MLIPTSAVQLVGLQYYQEIEQPIPRGQAEQVLKRVQETLGHVLLRLGCRDAAEADVLLAGSYRRGKPRTGEPTTFLRSVSLCSGQPLHVPLTPKLGRACRLP